MTEKSAFTPDGKTENKTGTPNVESSNPNRTSGFPSPDKDVNNPRVPDTSHPSASAPVGKATLSGGEEIREKNPRADKSVIGNTSVEARVATETGTPQLLQRIERVLRDGGMDSMSTIKALQAIGSILDDEETRRQGRAVDNRTQEQKAKDNEEAVRGNTLRTENPNKVK
jgi:hypothetical protein